MINPFAKQIMLTIFQIWTPEKAEAYHEHMRSVLYNPELTYAEVKQYSDKFTYLPPNAVIKRKKK